MSKKGVSTMFLIVMIILGLLTIALGFLFFGGAIETLQDKFKIFSESAEPNCNDRCVLRGYGSGVCLGVGADTSDCAEVYSEYCADGGDCCCKR